MSGPRRVRREEPDSFAYAAAYDVFAVCVRAGLPIQSAVEAVARYAPTSMAVSMTRTAELLELGADADHAWRTTDPDDTGFAELALLARRSARAGSSMAADLNQLAVATRAAASDRAIAAAERAGVKISGPLGLCFLPAFVCLGIVPVVIGLAGSVLAEM